MSETIVPPEIQYKSPHKINWADTHIGHIKTGQKGQDLVMDLEKNYLKIINKHDLADSVCQQCEDWAGYDILSFFPDGTYKYIEVKTTEGDIETPYFLSRNELEFLGKNRARAYIYRVSIGGDNSPSRLKVYTFSEVINAEVMPHNFKVKH